MSDVQTEYQTLMDGAASRRHDLLRILTAGANWYPPEPTLMFNGREVNALADALVKVFEAGGWVYLGFSTWGAYVSDLGIAKPWTVWQKRFIGARLLAMTNITVDELAALFATPVSVLQRELAGVVP